MSIAETELHQVYQLIKVKEFLFRVQFLKDYSDQIDPPVVATILEDFTALPIHDPIDLTWLLAQVGVLSSCQTYEDGRTVVEKISRAEIPISPVPVLSVLENFVDQYLEVKYEEFYDTHEHIIVHSEDNKLVVVYKKSTGEALKWIAL